MRPHRVTCLLLTGACLVALASVALPQSLPGSADLPDIPSPAVSASGVAPGAAYIRPRQQTELKDYVVNSFGPYPAAGAAMVAALDQIDSNPPEWRGGIGGYSRRFASDLGIEAVSTTTRHTLAAALREDIVYYRCVCAGLFPRLGHAFISTLTARRGASGHRVFSFSQLVAPYAGTMTAVYGWYPARFGAKDGLRIGNYNLLGEAGLNVGIEFFSGQRGLFSRLLPRNQTPAPASAAAH